MDDDLAAQARALLFAERNGVLSTISVHRAGYPYGSITPYALSPRGAPLILISTLAAHTKNLLSDPRACLFVGDSRAADDPQAGGRISLLGKATRVDAAEEADARARYLARIPQAADYFRTHDFQLWTLTVEEIRLIAGFGKITWLDGAAVMRDPAKDPLAKHVAGACHHMNQDHADALLTLCRRRGHHPAEGAARMVGVDVLGFDVETSEGRLRFDFPRELRSIGEVRTAMIEVLKETATG